AGKTGTAFVPDFGKNGYTDEVINTYMGFAPVSDPKFVILIKLDKPKGSPLAGQTVVPAFRELAQFILNYYNIAPDRLAASQ
ncbi:MAG: penicillin-binding transpeptidase domain-containing protein, partial [Patescibacteria group bacterium]